MQQLIQCRGIEAVKLINQFPLYELGAALAGLKSVCHRDVTDPFDQVYALWNARKNLAAVLDGDQPLHFCRIAATELLADISQKEHKLTDAGEGKTIEPFQQWQMRSVANKIDIFEHQLSGELKKTASYAVPERGIFNIELLAENAERHIHETVRHAVPDFALSEFKSAGRCLAFGLFSASGFHAARAVESVLKEYYAHFLPRNEEITMGLMASHLADLHKKKPPPPTLPSGSTLRHIRDVTTFDRNPLVHKNVDLEEIDAMTLLNSAQGAIVAMAKELLKSKDASAGFEPIDLVEFDIPEEPEKALPAPQPQGRKKSG